VSVGGLLGRQFWNGRVRRDEVQGKGAGSRRSRRIKKEERGKRRRWGTGKNN
jgi:hypothetical protein